MENRIESLVIGHQSIWIGFFVNKDALAATPSVLKSMLPMTAPSLWWKSVISLITFAQKIISHPISDSAKKTEIVLLKNSGIVVAVAMNVDAATSY